jgi:polynucleotide 5'-kinase involved in rRNA processing
VGDLSDDNEWANQLGDAVKAAFLAGVTLEATKRSKKAGKAVVSSVVEAPKKIKERRKRRLSDWQRYIKNPKNHIKFKSGKRKGQLDLAKMSRAYKRGRKK